MKIVIALSGVALLASSSGAFAQSNDATYCTALTDTYNKYVLTSGSRGARQTPTADIAAAMSKCSTSDAGAAIPVLENALKAAKVDLPSRG